MKKFVRFVIFLSLIPERNVENIRLRLVMHVYITFVLFIFQIKIEITFLRSFDLRARINEHAARQDYTSVLSWKENC